MFTLRPSVLFDFLPEHILFFIITSGSDTESWPNTQVLLHISQPPLRLAGPWP